MNTLHQYFHCRRRVSHALVTLDPSVLRACLARLAAEGTPLKTVYGYAPPRNPTPARELDRYVDDPFRPVPLEVQVDLVDAYADHDLHDDPVILTRALIVGNNVFAVALFQRGVKPSYFPYKLDFRDPVDGCTEEMYRTQQLFGALADVGWLRRRDAVVFWVHVVF